jgi:hypothetical protein
MRARHRATPTGTARCGRCGSTGASRPLRYFDGASPSSVPAKAVSKPCPQRRLCPNALTATHASDTDREIQLTTKPLSHHSARQGKRQSLSVQVARACPPAHQLDGDGIPNASQNRVSGGRRGPEMAGTQASARFGVIRVIIAGSSVRYAEMITRISLDRIGEGGMLRLTVGNRPQGRARRGSLPFWARAGPMRGSERGHADPDH